MIYSEILILLTLYVKKKKSILGSKLETMCLGNEAKFNKLQRYIFFLSGFGVRNSSAKFVFRNVKRNSTNDKDTFLLLFWCQEFMCEVWLSNSASVLQTTILEFSRTLTFLR